VAAVTVAGLLCQPMITAGVEALTRIVPDRARGEALGFHGTAMTGGSALGAPVAGAAIDAGGAPAAFLLAAGLGLAIAVGGALTVAFRRRPPRSLPATDE
jgi:MFS family permease